MKKYRKEVVLIKNKVKEYNKLLSECTHKKNNIKVVFYRFKDISKIVLKKDYTFDSFKKSLFNNFKQYEIIVVCMEDIDGSFRVDNIINRNISLTNEW